jgi:hypothetical protein
MKEYFFFTLSSSSEENNSRTGKETKFLTVLKKLRLMRSISSSILIQRARNFLGTTNDSCAERLKIFSANEEELKMGERMMYY